MFEQTVLEHTPGTPLLTHSKPLVQSHTCMHLRMVICAYVIVYILLELSAVQASYDLNVTDKTFKIN